MKNIRLFFIICTVLVFAASVSGQTVVRSLDNTNPNTPKQEKKTNDNEDDNYDNQNNPNRHEKATVTDDPGDYSRYSLWGFGVGYAYEFPVSGGNAGDGMHGMRIPVYFNHVFKSAPVGIYGLIGYEFNKSKSKIYGTTYETLVHRIPILAHVSYNFGKPNTSFFFHGGPGLNVLAGGSMKYLKDAKKKKYEKTSMKSGCGFTLGFGMGFVINKTLIIHFGFNGALTGDGAHQCDLDASVHFAF